MIIKRFLLSVYLLLFAFGGFAQQNWGGGADDETIHFGFTFQYSSTEFKIQKTNNWQNISPKPNLQSLTSPLTPGFALGFVSDLRIGTHLNLRCTPALAFNDRVIEYLYDGIPAEKLKIQSTVIDVPLGFKLKSDRRKNFRAYLIGGIKYAHDITSRKKNSAAIQAPTIKRNILSYETGIGFDLYFEYFKLSPEIKLANSFKNVLNNDSTVGTYSAPMDKIFLRNLQFSLYFE